MSGCSARSACRRFPPLRTSAAASARLRLVSTSAPPLPWRRGNNEGYCLSRRGGNHLLRSQPGRFPCLKSTLLAFRLSPRPDRYATGRASPLRQIFRQTSRGSGTIYANVRGEEDAGGSLPAAGQITPLPRPRGVRARSIAATLQKLPTLPSVEVGSCLPGASWTGHRPRPQTALHGG